MTAALLGMRDMYSVGAGALPGVVGCGGINSSSARVAAHDDSGLGKLLKSV